MGNEITFSITRTFLRMHVCARVCTLKVTVSGLPGSQRQTGKSPALCSCVKCKQSRGWCVGAGAGDKRWEERGRARGSRSPRRSAAALSPDEPGSSQERARVLFALPSTAPWVLLEDWLSRQPRRRVWIISRGVRTPGSHADAGSAGGVPGRGGFANSSVRSERHAVWDVGCGKAEEGD